MQRNFSQVQPSNISLLNLLCTKTLKHKLYIHPLLLNLRDGYYGLEFPTFITYLTRPGFGLYSFLDRFEQLLSLNLQTQMMKIKFETI